MNMGEGMLTKYEFFLNILKTKDKFSVLELGAGPDFNMGASVRMWQEYFQGADIHVVDNKLSARELKAEGFEVYIGDLGRVDFFREFANNKWDLVIDDASHLWAHQILAFREIFPFVVSGGVYIVEDLCTSYGRFRADYSKGTDLGDAVNYFLSITRGVCFTQTIDSDEEIKRIYNIGKDDENLIKKIDMISWIGNSCIIIKR